MTGIVYVGGIFTKVGEVERNHLATIGPDGILQSWNPDVKCSSYPDLDTIVKAIAINESTIYIGGKFSKIGKKERNNLAAIDVDGKLLDWNPNVMG